MKLLRRRCWLFLGMLVSGCQLLPAAQTGQIVEKIEIRHIGPPAVSDDLVRANIHVKVGDRYNPLATDNDIQSLKATGYFYDIRIARDFTDGGVKQIYVLLGQPVISEI